jgi:hypothetical protein
VVCYRVTFTFSLNVSSMGLGWRSSVTSRKVPGWIPGGVTAFFSVASDNSMCPQSTQPLKMSTRILLWVKTAGSYD